MKDSWCASGGNRFVDLEVVDMQLPRNPAFLPRFYFRERERAVPPPGLIVPFVFTLPILHRIQRKPLPAHRDGADARDPRILGAASDARVATRAVDEEISRVA